MKRHFANVVVAVVLAWLGTASVFAQSSSVGVAGSGKLAIKPLVEKKIAELPAGALFWRVETFPTPTEAQTAAGPTSLVAQADGKTWLFTLGAAGGSSNGGTKMAELGPISVPAASHYLLRIIEASGPPGSTTPVHSHPGVETVYVLAGEESFRTPDGVKRLGAGQGSAGRPETAMQASSSGSADLHALVMFVVDASKPFSRPTKLP